jgi:hypothetical protein
VGIFTDSRAILVLGLIEAAHKSSPDFGIPADCSALKKDAPMGISIRQTVRESDKFEKRSILKL